MPRRIAAAVAALALAARGAAAQISASATLASNYWFRGVSLSRDRPVARADVGYDDSSGAYAGAFASSVKFADFGGLRVETLGYGGYARSVGPGASVDAGATYAEFPGRPDYDYLEVHAGFTIDDLSTSIYYAPNYFGQGARTVYAELNLAHAAGERLRILAHAGHLLAWPRPGATGATRRGQTDFQLGAALQIDRLRVQFARAPSDRASRVYPIYAADGRVAHGAWILSLSLSL